MTKRPKGKLFALLAVFVAIGLVTASGAFTSVSAERTVSVSTAGDGSALLQLGVSNTNLASITDGQLEIDIGSINLNAQSDLGVVFTITNNGNDNLNTGVYIADESSEAPDGFSLSGSDDVSYRDGSGNIEGSTNSTTLDAGNQLDIRMVINTQGVTNTGSLGVSDIVIVAEQ
jgi:hypothetical protein